MSNNNEGRSPECHPFALCAYSKGGTLGNVPLFSNVSKSKGRNGPAGVFVP